MAFEGSLVLEDWRAAVIVGRGCQRACALLILVLRECIWNTPAVSLVLPAFDDGFSFASGGLSPWLNGSTLGYRLPCPCGEYGG